MRKLCADMLESGSYRQGYLDASVGTDLNRASFMAILKMPTLYEPLRLSDFFAFDDYLHGFYSRVVEQYKEKERSAVEYAKDLERRLNEYQNRETRPRARKARASKNRRRS